MANTCEAYNQDLEPNAANHQPLTPLGFLDRAANVFPDHIAIIHGSLQRTYQEFFARSRRLASALSASGISRGDTVSVMLANTPAMLECHYGVPMCRGVLHAINTRLDPATIAFQLDHAAADIVIVDMEFMAVMQQALEQATVSPVLIVYDDVEYSGERCASSAIDYEAFVSGGDANYAWLMPEDEWDAIAIGYTSGTTGDPKGVVSHHRGAYLLAQGNAMTTSMPKHAVYLWTLPMFHCNGWCFPWTLSAVAGTHICLRQVRAEHIWHALIEHKVSQLCGAPIVMSLILAGQGDQQLSSRVQFLTAAAPPPEKTLASMSAAGFDVVHLYGLTETYGPAVVNEWHQEWNHLPVTEQAGLKARQGVRYLPLEGLTVLHPETMQPVKHDGQELGEVMFRGNVVMKGYFKNPAATAKAFEGGWFHSGDLGVVHADGYIQLKDRSKDIIISGGENISSIEVEDALYKHPAIAVVAVVAMPDAKWGERPCAFVELASEQDVTAPQLLDWCREYLAGYKVPAHIEFGSIPRTATGKIQKFALRQTASDLAARL
ncbi:MAG: acyl-CoA synthetase [Gammaproteobacteria bacterium]|jgi:fatty-acyl-CoA synthase|nr:acyl-CoA synthetase [Gammaproteobacteria bacterium]